MRQGEIKTIPIDTENQNRVNFPNVTDDIPEEDNDKENEFNMDLTPLWIALGINGGLYGILLFIYGVKVLKSAKKKSSSHDHFMIGLA